MYEEVFDHDICAECGGKCCKHGSCLAHPNDFGDTHEQVIKNLRSALESGMWIVDYWEGQCPSLPEGAEGFFIRPRMIEDLDLHPERESNWCVPSWGGECLFLTPEGCSLDDSTRPLGGRSLVPKIDSLCIQTMKWKEDDRSENEKPTFALAWLPYEEEIWNMIRENDEW